MNRLTSLNCLQQVKNKAVLFFHDLKSYNQTPFNTEEKRERTKQKDGIRLIELEDEDNFLIILLLAVMFSVTLPILLISSPCMIMDGSVFVLFILLVFVAPITLLVSSNIGDLLPEVIYEYF